MSKQWKRLLAGLLAAAALLSATTAVPVYSAGDAAPADTAQDDKTDDVTGTDVSDYVQRTAREVLKTMVVAAENEKLRFYAPDYAADTTETPREDLFAVENKETGYIWWSSPINAGGDGAATPVLQKELRSAVVMTYGQPAERSTTNVRSADPNKCRITGTAIKDGVRVNYNFNKAGIQIPVEYTLCADYLSVTVDTANIKEQNSSDTGKLVTELTLLGAFGAGGSEDEGYFVLPDGSGALVNFNNGKTNVKPYARKVYGADATAVPNTRGAVTEGLFLPVYGIVRDKNALLVVAEEGDGNAILNTAVSGQSKSSYNLCNFRFVLRSTDVYYMGGETNPLTVFERGAVKTEAIKLRYYPVADAADTTDYVDLAAKYRDYLTTDGGVTVRAKENSVPLYADIYQGVEKPKSILGIPVTMKTAMTRFSQAQEIAATLRAQGVDELVLGLNGWTSDGIAGQVDYKAKGASVLGGNGDFQDLLAYCKDNDIACYPTVDNRTFTSGNGYFSFFHTTMRVSGAYARLYPYERAFGTPDTDKENRSLLTPAVFTEIYEKLAKNYKKAGIGGVSIGSMTTALYGDYGKKAISRERAMQTLAENLDGLQSTVGSVLARSANAYALPYVDYITDVPVSSSGFDVFDGDIPFYQLVLHGVIPYATKAVNGSPDADTLLLKAIAAGSGLQYDLLYADTSTLKDTDFDIYFYAKSSDWTDIAAADYKRVRDLLGDVSDQTITDYQTVGDVITTTYADGTVLTVNLKSGEITRDGVAYTSRDDAAGEATG